MTEDKTEEIKNELNKMCDLDYEAIRSLMELKVPCNSQLAENVITTGEEGKDQEYITFLGLINTLFFKDSKYRIARMIQLENDSDDGYFSGFSKVLRSEVEPQG